MHKFIEHTDWLHSVHFILFFFPFFVSLLGFLHLLYCRSGLIILHLWKEFSFSKYLSA
jgi:hypothetical protein